MMILTFAGIMGMFMADDAQSKPPVRVQGEACQPATCKAAARPSAARTTPPSATDAVDRRMITATLASEIRPHFARCAAKGDEANLIITKLNLRLRQDGFLIGVDYLGQAGVNEQNRRYAEIHKRCAINAVRVASPFSNLPVEQYEQWKHWPMHFKSR